MSESEMSSSDQSAPVSDTPKTDAALFVAFYGGNSGLFVKADFARAQERMIASLVSDLRSIANNIMAPRYFREIAASAIRRAEA